tara:strand:+ start:906 stop:1040 length:135 start_codon:yes stop_codon:yes gene_type:complete
MTDDAIKKFYQLEIQRQFSRTVIEFDQMEQQYEGYSDAHYQFEV